MRHVICRLSKTVTVQDSRRGGMDGSGRTLPESPRGIFGLSMQQNQNTKTEELLVLSLADAMNGPGSGAADAEVRSQACSKPGSRCL